MCVISNGETGKGRKAGHVTIIRHMMGYGNVRYFVKAVGES